MCGFFGMTGDNREVAAAATATIRHRGPDATGIYSDAAVSLGFDRLAIIDLDPRSNQPLWDAAHEIGVVFNGEIYNYKDLKAELEQEYEFHTSSDTEVLIYAYKKWGPSFASKLRGMFAFAIYDTPRQRITLFRDHAGIKPLLYHHTPGRLIFGSEMKAVTAAMRSLGVERIVDRDAIGTYFALGYMLSPATMYANVRKVPRGSYVEYDIAAGTLSEPTHVESAPTIARTEDELASLAETAILEHLIADVPVGLFFSGGTDSSLIVSVLHKHHINLETFSIAIEGHKVDKKYFEEISAHLGLAAHTFEFTPTEFDAVYEPVMRLMDEPFTDMSIFPTYYISQKAAERVKVVLSGEGGDELFFGYDRQRALARLRGVRLSARLSLSEQVFLRTPSFPGKNKLFEKLFVLLREPASAYLLAMSPARDRTHVHAWAAAKAALVATATDPLYFDRDVYLENDLLRKTDFATSFNSIEGRVPLLDPRIMAAAIGFESAYVPAAPSKPILKRLLARYLPAELVYRPKRGFGISLVQVLPHSPALARDLDAAISYLEKRDLLLATLPTSRTELVARYPNLCFALVCLYRALKNDA
ncbi:asparagine synthase (glutamine-hydrolyzing) [Candidatus Kaiserbacteria bacterium]|nr:asparagine synthase (glutamine-hydrolyzing) [Candidatus Kaiserbacteria bacterium]